MILGTHDLDTTTMTAEELTTVETHLDMRLPRAYHECIALVESLPPTDWDVFITDATVLIEANEEVRREGFFGLEWPNHYFIVGNDGAGNVYYLDLHEEGEPHVFTADHETKTFESALDWYDDNRLRVCFIAWMQSYRNRLAEAERRPPRRWWQFWRPPPKGREM